MGLSFNKQHHDDVLYGSVKTENKLVRMTSTGPLWKRRALFAGGALALVVWVKGAPQLLSLGEPELEFEDIAGLAPFRRLIGAGSITSGAAIFAGLDAPEPVAMKDAQVIEAIRNDLCTAVFGPSQADLVPVAMFSDFRCPICNVMNGRLSELQNEMPDRFRIVRHELPILGISSATASRAVLAADLQSAYLEMHSRLVRTPAVTDEAFIEALAVRMGLDAHRLLRDMRSEAIENKLRVTRGIASLFGFYGTPGFVVGRTVFLGSISKAVLRELIELEVGNGVGIAATRPC